MNRRQLIGAAAMAGAALSATATLASAQARVSCEKGDPGERLYAELCGDGKVVRVYLGGVEQFGAVTADPALGYVKRAVRTARGNLAINRSTGEIYHEEVYGAVRWEVGADMTAKITRKAGIS